MARLVLDGLTVLTRESVGFFGRDMIYFFITTYLQTPNMLASTVLRIVLCILASIQTCSMVAIYTTLLRVLWGDDVRRRDARCQT